MALLPLGSVSVCPCTELLCALYCGPGVAAAMARGESLPLNCGAAPMRDTDSWTLHLTISIKVTATPGQYTMHAANQAKRKVVIDPASHNQFVLSDCH
jgi:hypothetical protein